MLACEVNFDSLFVPTYLKCYLEQTTMPKMVESK